MSWIAVAGVAVTAVGAGMSAKGAADNAAAMAAAYDQAGDEEDALFGRQSKNLNKLINKKNKKLKNLGNIFDRFESTGAFGDTNTLANLRKAQEDYSALAAGDFSGFESQLRQSLSDSLIATAGSGAPIGTFAGLAAQDQLALRGQGIETAMGISGYLSGEANQLLGQEFGIMDQRFNTQYQMDRTRTTNMANYSMGQAGTVGVATQAYGNATQQIGSSFTSYGMNQQNKQMLTNSNNAALINAGGVPRANDINTGMPYAMPASYQPSASNYSAYSAPSSRSSWESGPSAVYPYPSIGAPPSDYGGVLPPRNDVYASTPASYQAMEFGDAWRYETQGPYRSSSSILNNVGAGIAGR